jgi:hypothetical protein
MNYATEGVAPTWKQKTRALGAGVHAWRQSGPRRRSAVGFNNLL